VLRLCRYFLTYTSHIKNRRFYARQYRHSKLSTFGLSRMQLPVSNRVGPRGDTFIRVGSTKLNVQPLLSDLFNNRTAQSSYFKVVTEFRLRRKFIPLYSTNQACPTRRPRLTFLAPATYFPGTLFYSASFNVNQNFKKTNF
jgi:hypothetical protein